MPALTHSKITSYHQPTILVVEDDEDNLVYVCCALDLFDYRCLIAQDAISGLSLAQEYQPDLILLDIQLPQVSGIELLKILKLDWLTRQIPIVALTALAREQDQKLIREAGFDNYLLKPYLLEDLEQVICNHISNTSLC